MNDTFFPFANEFDLDDVATDIHIERVVAANGSVMTGPGTNTWLVGNDTHVVVIDPGPALDEHIDAIVAAIGSRTLTSILVTHTHMDHSPGVALLRDRIPTTVLGIPTSPTAPETVEFFDRAFTPDVVPRDGHELAIGNAVLTAVHTPGHASNHVCWLLTAPKSSVAEHRSVLFSGDHIMDGSTVVIPPPDGNMSAYLWSLQRVLELNAFVIAPGHGNLIHDVAERIRGYIEHRLDRETQVGDVLALATEPITAHEVVALLYRELDPKLVDAAAYVVWAHLERLAELGDVQIAEADGVLSTWRSAR